MAAPEESSWEFGIGMPLCLASDCLVEQVEDDRRIGFHSD